jgi:hypothetical protein
MDNDRKRLALGVGAPKQKGLSRLISITERIFGVDGDCDIGGSRAKCASSLNFKACFALVGGVQGPLFVRDN